MEHDKTTGRRQRIREEAATWVVRLSGEAGDRDRTEFEDWRGQGVEHEIAFERELAAWERLDWLRALRVHAPLYEVAEDEVIGRASVIPKTTEPGLASRRQRQFRWRAMTAGFALLAGAGAIIVTTLGETPAYATGIGERRLVRLDDGSAVELNTDSRIRVRYARQRRTVDVVRGEASFHVVAESRPFVIHAEGAEIEASKADLAVRADAASVAVTVTSGTVLAAAEDRTDARLVSVGPGSQALVRGGSVAVHPVSTDEIAQMLAWRQGAIALDGRTLAEAAAEFNRYNLRKLYVGDPRVGTMRVGGYFRANDVEGFVAALVQALPIQATTGDNGAIVLTRH